MASKTTSVRNTERRNGKAWGKNHNAPVKILSPEAQERKAKKDARRAQVVRHEKGSSITMPRITWEWAGEIMAARWPNTRRVRMLDACLAQERGRGNDDYPSVIESNPEVRSARKNGR